MKDGPSENTKAERLTVFIRGADRVLHGHGQDALIGGGSNGP